MNFSVSDGIGLLGGWILFGALMIAFIVIVALVVRVVRGRDDSPAPPGERAPDEDPFL